jgi:lipopolysaccharide biosynthesis glycosyltransferase
VTSNSTQAVVCCVTQNWVAAAAVTLLSCAAAGQVSEAALLICAHGATDEDRGALLRFNARHGLAIRLIDVGDGGVTQANLGRFGIGTLLRLSLDQALAREYSRVLYLDADVLAVQDVRPLLAAELAGKTIGAVPDLGIDSTIREKVKVHREELGLADDELYFNAGMLLFDWQATLASDALQRVRAKLAERPRWRALDQDALNMALRHEWKPLPYKWNVTGLIQQSTAVEPAIYHFTASEKPWMSRRFLWHRRFHAYYVASFAGTGWEAFAEPRDAYGLMRATGEAARKLFHFKRRAAIAAAVAATKFE